MGLTPEHKSNKPDGPGGRSRKKKSNDFRFYSSRKIIAIAGLSVAAILALSVAVYGWLGQKYRQVFFPNTTINGLDVSGHTVAEVETLIAGGMDGYILTLKLRGGEMEQIDSKDINLHPEFDGSLERIISEQNPWEWGSHSMNGSQHTIETMMAYDQDQLTALFEQLACLDETKTVAPTDAQLSEYQEGVGYQIIPEQAGTRLMADVVWTEVTRAILNLQPELVLEELNAYVQPQIISTDEWLNERLAEWNRYVGVTVKYQFGSQTEVLDGSTIHTWLSEDANQNVILDQEAVAAYVKTLAEKYNTAYTYKNFKTSYGPTVTIKGGNYGWRINQGVESTALTEIIKSGTGQTREPVYSQTANSHTAPDYGDNYVEINLTAQHLYYYKDGKLLVESDFVSGNESKGWGTPAGAYPLTYKQRDATLTGENYSTPVSYWMPFNGGVGLHDAPWRGAFGGEIYKTSGSHGCVNLPPAVAQKIYENITAGTPVICYFLEGTESKPVTPPPVTETTAAPTQPAETTAPTETTAAPAESSAPAESTSPEPQPTEDTPELTPEPIIPPPTTAPPEPATTAASNGPGGEQTKPESGVVDRPGM